VAFDCEFKRDSGAKPCGYGAVVRVCSIEGDTLNVCRSHRDELLSVTASSALFAMPPAWVVIGKPAVHE